MQARAGRASGFGRRDMLRAAANGFGALALQHLLSSEASAANRPLAAKEPHFKASAKSVIFIFNVGAPSSMDTFDPKPMLTKHEGKLLPESFGKIGGQFTDGTAPSPGHPMEVQKIRAERAARVGTFSKCGTARR